jgi:hypothetical protein
MLRASATVQHHGRVLGTGKSQDKGFVWRRNRITSNLPFDERTSVFGSDRLTGALLDRLTHHVHILEMNGDSYELNQSKRRSRRNNADTPKEDLTPI